MDAVGMIHRLKNSGVEFAEGMTAQELDCTEEFFRFRFPTEIRAFLSCGVPMGSSFFQYRERTEENYNRFLAFQQSIKESFLYDLANNREDMAKLFSDQAWDHLENGAFDGAVLAYLEESVKLIPFYAHRCFFDGMDGMPIVSFWQPVDSIIYGSDFENYLACEFLGGECYLDHMPERLKQTGIWYEVIAFSFMDETDE